MCGYVSRTIAAQQSFRSLTPPLKREIHMSQNLYELFTSDPVEANLKAMKAKLAISLVELIRARDWNQAVAAENLSISRPRMSNLFRGQLEKFSVDALFQMLMRVGYTLETSFDPLDHKEPLSITLKRGVH